MSTNTTNYALIKPDPTENASIGVVNANTDDIDTELRSRTFEAITAHTRVRYNGTRHLELGRDTPDVEYVRGASTTDEFVDILDQDLLDYLEPLPVNMKINAHFSFEARRETGSGDAFFDLSVVANSVVSPDFVPGGSLITYGRRDTGASFETIVDERAFDQVTETIANAGKVSSTVYRVHEFLIQTIPVNPQDQVFFQIEIKTGATPIRIMNPHVELTVEW